jgi:hypothetical protein
MNRFHKLQNIKETFDDKLYQTDDFKITKGLLYNFGAYIEANKGILYDLLGASLFNMATNSMPVNNAVTTPAFNNPVVISQMKNKLDSNLINSRGMDVYSKIEEFKKNSQLGNTIQNHRYAGQVIHKLNADSIKDLKNGAEGSVKIFENPFWKGNVVEIESSNYYMNKFVFSNYYLINDIKVNTDNSLLLTDNSEQKLYYNHQDVNEFARYSDTKNIELMTKYIVYHEAAHGAFRQAYTLGRDSNVLKNEVHSDISSLTMIGVESKSLAEFNEAVDMIMQMRVKSLKDGDYGHNDSYAISELKKVINDNPDLLKMKVEDISEFSYILTDTLFKENVKKNNADLLEKMGINLDQKSIFNDLKAYRNLDLYDSVGVKITSQYMFKTSEMIKEGMDSRIDKFAERIAKTLDNQMQFDTTSTLMFRENGGNVAKTTQAIHDRVEKNPIISKSVIDPIKQKVHIDGLEYDLSKVNDIRLNQIAKESQAYVNKHNYKI